MFWRQHGAPLLGSTPYHEFAPHLVLMSFLRRADGDPDPLGDGLVRDIKPSNIFLVNGQIEQAVLGVLYQCLTGLPPFGAEHVAAVSRYLEGAGESDPILNQSFRSTRAEVRSVVKSMRIATTG